MFQFSWKNLATLLLPAAFIVGCDYNKQTAETHELYDTGNYQQAAQVAHEQADKADKRDALILRLEEGALYRVAGELPPSNVAFHQADDLASAFDDEPETKISQEAVAALVNQTALDYRGTAYDRIMMNTYEALNFMELGNLDNARVMVNRAYERQQEAVQRYSQEIAANQQVQQQHQTEYNQAVSDPNVQAGLNQQYAALNVQDLSAYKDYVNPFTQYIRGLYLLHCAVDASDLDQGRQALRRAAGLAQGNTFILQDAQLADQAASGAPIPPTTYVIFETGKAPARGQFKFDIPVWINGTVETVAAAIPTLVYQPCESQELYVQAGGQNYTSQVVCDMDKVVTQEFKNQLPVVITRTIISTIIKTVSQYAANEAAKRSGNWIEQVASNVGTSVYIAASNQADTRTWKTLPKLFSVARFPTPADRNLTITLAGNGATFPLTLEPGVVNVVYVKFVDAAAPPVVRQFKLK